MAGGSLVTGRLQHSARAALLAVLALGQSACHDPDAYTLSPDRIDQIVSVTASAGSIPADGATRLTITVQIDPRVDARNRTVTITTSGGTLVWGNQQGAAVTVPADESGKAVVDLRSGTTSGPVTLDISVGLLTRTLSVQFTSVRREDLFGVDVSRTTLPADGFSTTRITVTLKAPAAPAQRTVTFETSAGTLIGTGIASARKTSVTADPDGVASIDLQSDKTIGPVRVAITALERTETLELSFVPADPAQIIAVTAEPRSVAADGASTIAVIARVSPNLPGGRRSVTFRTTVGQFVPGQRGEIIVEADGSNQAQATLVSVAIGTARLTATVDGNTSETTVDFMVALPDSVFVSAAAASIRAGQSTAVTATLLRNVGEVSPRLEVAFSAVTAAGASIGTFSGVTLSDHGIASATFNAGATPYLGPVTIRASVSGAASGTTALTIVP
jgi:hypothetical protein